MGGWGKVLSAPGAAAVGVRMDGNLSGFTNVPSLHYHGIQSNSDASEWISRGMRQRGGFSGCRRVSEGAGRGQLARDAKFRYTDDNNSAVAATAKSASFIGQIEPAIRRGLQESL